LKRGSIISNRKATITTDSQRKVLEALLGEARTWDELRATTKLNDERLGFTIGELLNLRKIWTAIRGEVRVYGFEQRIGLVPRLQNLQRRADDSGVQPSPNHKRTTTLH
jgi:hypothetical protein